jgi:hypothetical protein
LEALLLFRAAASFNAAGRSVQHWPFARSATKGQQRAEDGTATARNFNYGSNTPHKLKCSDTLLQLLQGGEAAAAAAAGTQLYVIKSTHTASGLVCIAIARESSGQPAAGEDPRWDVAAAATCKKRVQYGTQIDLLNLVFKTNKFVCCVGAPAALGRKRKQQPE